jgi:RNA polymerase sigma-70 factor, ECF subfamily
VIEIGRSRIVTTTMSDRSALAAKVVVDPVPPAASIDRARLGRMFESHHELVWRTLRRRGLSADAAADTTQQAFLIAAERLSDIRPESERAFLVGTALRLVRSAQRRAVRLQFENDMDLRVDPARDKIAERAAIALFDAVLSELDPTLAEVFVLFELDGFSSPEIAQMTDVPLGTVASRLRRAREEFRIVARRIEPTLKREANQ